MTAIPRALLQIDAPVTTVFSSMPPGLTASAPASSTAAEAGSGDGTEVLGTKVGSSRTSSAAAAGSVDTATRDLVVPADAPSSRLASVGTWLLPVAVTLALMVAITGVGAMERLRRRWYRR